MNLKGSCLEISLSQLAFKASAWWLHVLDCGYISDVILLDIFIQEANALCTNLKWFRVQSQILYFVGCSKCVSFHHATISSGHMDVDFVFWWLKKFPFTWRQFEQYTSSCSQVKLFRLKSLSCKLERAKVIQQASVVFCSPPTPHMTPIAPVGIL